jgi:CRP-like cAMP-binding protein
MRRLPAGRYVYGQNEAALRSVFLVFEGQTILETEINGWRFTLGRLQRGEAFGGIGLVASVPTPESAIAGTDLVLLEIEPFTFRYLEVVRPLLARRLRQIVFESFLSRVHNLLEINLPTDARSREAGRGGRS